jgi:membrane protein DedA with SNARE-associated domain
MEVFIQNYGYLAVFLLTAFDHSGTPLGILLSIGLVTTGELDLMPTFIVATSGGIFGDILLYALGYIGGSKAVSFFKRRGKSTREGIERAEVFLEKYGAPFLIWGRFMAFVGRYMSLVYGSIRYKPAATILFISIGSVLMTLIFGVPLYILGESFNEITSNDKFTLYLSASLITIQILATWAWYRWKKAKA